MKLANQYSFLMLTKAIKETREMAIKYQAGAKGEWVCCINQVANSGDVPPNKAMAVLKVKAKPE